MAHTHRYGCEILRLTRSYDQLDVSVLASAELLVRWLVQVQAATERSARCPGYPGLDIAIAAPVSAA